MINNTLHKVHTQPPQIQDRLSTSPEPIVTLLVKGEGLVPISIGRGLSLNASSSLQNWFFFELKSNSLYFSFFKKLFFSFFVVIYK